MALSLLRADDLAQLTLAGLQAFSSYGVETVVDLHAGRTKWPTARAPSRPCPETHPL